MPNKKKPEPKKVLPAFEYGNPAHQIIGVKLTIMYWAHGDFKGIWDDEDDVEWMKDELGLNTDDELLTWIHHNRNRFDDSYLQLNPHTGAQALEKDDFEYFS